MSKFKTIIALCVMAAILSLCAVSAVASVSFSTSVYWGPLERSAWAETVATGTSGLNVLVNAYILSRSTGQFEEVFKPSYNSGSSVTATTAPVEVSYPSPIPLVNYGGGVSFLE